MPKGKGKQYLSDLEKQLTSTQGKSQKSHEKYYGFWGANGKPPWGHEVLELINSQSKKKSR
tara:strand:- start:898 stop:1080 length:183 start_codon:yes stop_codon:yes gene_type:complete